MLQRVTAGALVIFALGLLPRVFGLRLWGTYDDIEIQKAWSWRAATGGVADIYGPSDVELAGRRPGAGFPEHVFEWNGNRYFVDYPPASVLVLWAQGTLYRALFPDMPNRRWFNVAVNLGAFLGSLAVAVLLLRSSREHGPRRAAFYWLNPAMILCVPILGYQDTLFGAAALGALMALQRERYATSAALTVVAGLLKPQGALLLPVLAVGLLRDARGRHRWTAAAAGLGAAALLLAPWWTTGHLLSAIDGGLRPLRQPTLAPLGLNVWWIAGWAMKWAQEGPWPLASITTIEDFRHWAGVDPRLIGRVLFLGAAAAVGAWLWRRPRDDRDSFAAAMVVLVHAYALLSTSVHENHTFFAVLAALLLIGTVPGATRAVLWTSAFLFVNVFLMAGGLGRHLTPLRQLEAVRMAASLDLSVLVAGVHVALVVGLAVWNPSIFPRRPSKMIGLSALKMKKSLTVTMAGWFLKVLGVGLCSGLLTPLAMAADAVPLAKRGPLRVLAYPEKDRPEFFATDGNRPGFEREILEGFAKANKLALEVVIVPKWEALVPALTEGKGDIIAGHFTNTEERREHVAFTQGLLPTRSVILTRKPKPAVHTLKQLQAEKVGAIKGSAVLEDLLAAGVPRANIDDSITPNNILEALRSGKVTALVRSVPLAVLSQRDDPEIQLGMFLGGGSQFAFGVAKGDIILLDALNSHIDLINQTGQWNRLVVKYFGANAVDILKKAQSN